MRGRNRLSLCDLPCFLIDSPVEEHVGCRVETMDVYPALLARFCSMHHLLKYCVYPQFGLL
jgi:hypothetical protein